MREEIAMAEQRGGQVPFASGPGASAAGSPPARVVPPAHGTSGSPAPDTRAGALRGGERPQYSVFESLGGRAQAASATAPREGSLAQAAAHARPAAGAHASPPVYAAEQVTVSAVPAERGELATVGAVGTVGAAGRAAAVPVITAAAPGDQGSPASSPGMPPPSRSSSVADASLQRQVPSRGQGPSVSSQHVPGTSPASSQGGVPATPPASAARSGGPPPSSPRRPGRGSDTRGEGRSTSAAGRTAPRSSGPEVIDLAALEREVDGVMESRGVSRSAWQRDAGAARQNLSDMAYKWALELMRDSFLLTWQECLSAAEALDYTPPPLPSQDPAWREMIHPTHQGPRRS